MKLGKNFLDLDNNKNFSSALLYDFSNLLEAK